MKAEDKTLPVVSAQAPFRPKKRPNDNVKIAADKGKKTTRRYTEILE